MPGRPRLFQEARELHAELGYRQHVLQRQALRQQTASTTPARQAIPRGALRRKGGGHHHVLVQSVLDFLRQKHAYQTALLHVAEGRRPHLKVRLVVKPELRRAGTQAWIGQQPCVSHAPARGAGATLMIPRSSTTESVA